MKTSFVYGGIILVLIGALSGCSKLSLSGGEITCLTQNESWISCDIEALSENYIVYTASHEHLGSRYIYLYDFEKKTRKKIMDEAFKSCIQPVSVSGNRMVYEHKGVIYLYEIDSGKERPLHPGCYKPDISGDRIIWRDSETFNLRLHDIKTGKIKEFGRVGQIFRISGEWLVWRLTGGGIRVLNLSTGEKKEADMVQVHYLDIAGVFE